MPRKNVTEIKSRFIAQIAEAERRLELAVNNQESVIARAKAEYDKTIASTQREADLAAAHLDGLKAALSLFEDPKRTATVEARGTHDRNPAEVN